MFFRQVAEENLSQYAYIVGCQKTGEAIVIDPMRDIDRYIEIAEAEELKIVAATETHIHADFLSGAREFAEQGARVYLSDEGDADWKYKWANDDRYDTVMVYDGSIINVGNIEIGVVHSPGHTPEHISFTITDKGGGATRPMGIATGDFVFVGDLGRPDLLETAAGVVGAQEPSARRLYSSVQSFLELPDYMMVWPGHGAGSACGKALGAVPESTVGYEKQFNASIRAMDHGEETFVSSILEGQPEPPIYFAEMKRLNKLGAPVLGRLPVPGQISGSELQKLKAEAVLVDTRDDRSDFMRRHIPGSLYAPANKSFPTVTGSYIKPDDKVILLVEDEKHVDSLVRNLVRIGLDNVAGYALVDDALSSGSTASIDEIDMSTIDGDEGPGTSVLDVRRFAEYEPAHVPGAINVAHTRLAARLDELPRDKKLLVHCRTGGRSAVAAAYLARQGFDAVYVNGSVEEWLANRGEVVTS